MAISFQKLRDLLENGEYSYYYLANNGIDPKTLHRLRHDQVVTTRTLDKLCRLLNCNLSEIVEYINDEKQ